MNQGLNFVFFSNKIIDQIRDSNSDEFKGVFLTILEKGKQEGIHSGFPDPRLR